MTGAELRTLRDSLGLSADAVAQMAGVKTRSVQRWEVDDWPVPQDVAELLQRLDALLERAVLGAVDGLQAVKKGRGAPQEVVLLRYRSAVDLARCRADMAALPPAVHGALVDRVRVAFARLGVASRIVWMDAEAYEAWRGKRRDSDALRSQWAAEQLPPAGPKTA